MQAEERADGSGRRAEILERLSVLIEPYVRNRDAFASVADETHLLHDLDINSAHLVDIIIDVEDAFGIEIEDEAAERMSTVGEAVRIIEERVDRLAASSEASSCAS